MARRYTVQFDAATIAQASGDYDLFELVPADDKPIKVYGCFLYVTSELGDAAEEWLRLAVIRGHTTSGSTPVSTPTPQPLDPHDAAAGFTCEAVNSTPAVGGTPVNVHIGAMQVRAGFELWLPSGSEWKCSQAQTLLVVRLSAAVTDDVTMSGTLYVEEE